MKKLFLLFSFITCFIIASAQGITDSWNGVLDLGGAKMKLVLHIDETNDEYTGTMDSPDQGVNGIPISTVSLKNNELSLAIDAIKATYKADFEGDSLMGNFTQAGHSFPLTLKRGSVELPKRPQEPKLPFRYHSEDITFFNEEANIHLAGTFTYPQHGSDFPVVVLITGSGAQNRNEELLGHKPFLLLSDYLTNGGIAVLRFDDRGVAQSEGDFWMATSRDFATDVYAAVAYLKTRKEIDAKQIGLLGHSEGGYISFMVANKYPEDISFVISMAGSGVSGKEIIYKQSKEVLQIEGASEEVAADNQRLSSKIVELVLNNTLEYIKENIGEIVTKIASEENKEEEIVKRSIIQSSSPWFREFLMYNPQDDIVGVKAHVFALNGDKDIQVDADVNLDAIETNLIHAKSKKIKKYEGLNHLFQTATTGAVSEYTKIEETISPLVLKDILDWINELTK